MTDEKRQLLERLTVEVLLGARRIYLRHGGSPLRCREEILSRLRLVTEQTRDPKRWASLLLRKLRLPSPDNLLSLKISNLVHEVQAAGEREWQRLLRDEAEYLVAEMQLQAEERRKKRLDEENEEGVLP